VFAIGTFWRIPRLIADCPHGPATSDDCRVQRLTEHVLRAFAAGPAGLRHPSKPNLEALGIRPGYLRGGRPDDDPVTTSSPPSSTTSAGPTPTTGGDGN